MKYQDIVNLLRDTAETVNPNGTFVHGRKLFASTGSIDDPDPYINLLPLRWNPDLSNSYVQENLITIAFWKQDKPDSSPEEQEAIIAEMDELCRQFLLTLDLSEVLIIEEVRCEADYRQLMSTMTGVLLQFKETSGIDVC